ncbi:hypothetical protein O6H91_04G096700 [Diphasiastrum complanatum]|uniref:Uncharacterized protein n=1 Tax=Diphasiastrum complanatum TaxID=34168 RepID=A0ACC2DZS2_DIPCM|nr:hypothetical protein O6H91_04G096700 [Diphasiastrum complanatum]
MSSSSSDRIKLDMRKHRVGRSKTRNEFIENISKTCKGRSCEKSCSSSSDSSQKVRSKTARAKSNILFYCRANDKSRSRQRGRSTYTDVARNKERAGNYQSKHGVSSSSSRSSSSSGTERSSSTDTYQHRHRKKQTRSSSDTSSILSSHISRHRRQHWERRTLLYDGEMCCCCRHRVAQAKGSHARRHRRTVIWSEISHRRFKKRKRKLAQFSPRKMYKDNYLRKHLASSDFGTSHRKNHLDQQFCAEQLSEKSTRRQELPFDLFKANGEGRTCHTVVLGKSSAASVLKDVKSSEDGAAELEVSKRLDDNCTPNLLDLNKCSHGSLEQCSQLCTLPTMHTEGGCEGFHNWQSHSSAKSDIERQDKGLSAVCMTGAISAHPHLSFEERRYSQYHSSLSKFSCTSMPSDLMIVHGEQEHLPLASIDPNSNARNTVSPSRTLADMQMAVEGLLDETSLESSPPTGGNVLLQSNEAFSTESTAAAAAVQSSVYFEQDPSGEFRLVTHVRCQLTTENAGSHDEQPKQSITRMCGEDAAVSGKNSITEEPELKHLYTICSGKLPEVLTVTDSDEQLQVLTAEHEEAAMFELKEKTTFMKKGKRSRTLKMRGRKKKFKSSVSGVILESHCQNPGSTHATIHNLPSTLIEVNASVDKDDTASCCASDKQTLAQLIVNEGLFPPVKRNKWETGLLCDLCGRGPSLSLGEWYAWCCGARWIRCNCSKEQQMKLKKEVHSKARGLKAKQEMSCLSGKVHRMCALWSSEVFEGDDQGDQLEQLSKAVKRGVALPCADPDCRSFGATLGCRVKQCRRSFHYPCADKLASQCRLRMWEGYYSPIACHEHLHTDLCEEGKQPALQSKMRLLKRDIGGSKGGLSNSPSGDLICHEKLSMKVVIANTGILCGKSCSNTEIQQCNRKLNSLGTLSYFGRNLLCEDISAGEEQMKIPCTNDVDDEPLPSIHYITENRYIGQAAEQLQDLQRNEAKLARGCTGCSKELDNPEAPISVHAFTDHRYRENDEHFDWQGQPMYARLPYDCYGRLQLSIGASDIIECNSRCPCGSSCRNKELQKGLRISLEVFKTENRGWGVRTLEDIPRGRFVVEYVGEILTQTEADQRAEKHDLSSYNYLFNVDHPPEVPEKNSLVIDGFKCSNVARFINHSCDGNLKIYRVYTEILDFKLFRIGMYAVKDIQKGEELSYDYSYAHQEPNMNSTGEMPTSQTVQCLCETKQCRKWLWNWGS